MKEIPKYRLFLRAYSNNDELNRNVHDTGEVYINSYTETNKSIKFKVNYRNKEGLETELEFEEPSKNIKRIEEI